MAISSDQKLAIEQRFHQKYFWTRFAMVFLGIWMLTSPETFGYQSQALSISDWVSGLLLIFFGFVSMSFKHRLWIWGGCAVGIWLQMAPLLFWAAQPVIYLNDTLIGILAIAFCVLVPLRAPEFDVGPCIPKGWSYNPSSWQQRVPIILFGIIGWFVSRYLCAYQLHYIDSVWPAGTGTEIVITSMIANNFPVPDAGLGALAYCLEAIMGAKGGVRRWHTMPWLVIMFGILVVPLGFTSIVLVTLQPVVVGAWCVLCLIIATCMLIMLALTLDEVICVCQYIQQERKKGRAFFNVFFKGSNYEKNESEAHTQPFNQSPKAFLKSAFKGVGLPWNLILTALLGALLLFDAKLFGFSDLAEKNTDVVGALTVVFSIIAWAEVARAIRFVNLVLMAWLIVGSWILPGASTGTLLWAVAIGIIVSALSIFKGSKIKETYGLWQKNIF